MFPQKAKSVAEIDSKTYPLGEKIDHAFDAPTMALVALSHTPVERRLYAAMLTAMLTAMSGSADEQQDRPRVFTVRALMELTGIVSLSTIRRGLEGLVANFSVEREAKPNGNGSRDHGVAYRVFTPAEVIARREERGSSLMQRELAAAGRVVPLKELSNELSRIET